jgi:hypothetical protein
VPTTSSAKNLFIQIPFIRVPSIGR